ncbi:MAG: CRISPR-associated protein Csm2 [Candidatus Atribacteria bacterium]|nr:CRISPR-associated protein Csm2 [Candidatus Atribacteria bacterium]
MNMRAERNRASGPYPRKEDTASQEERWRKNLKEAFSTPNYAEKILRFDRMEMDEFKEFNQKLKDFMKQQAGKITFSRMRKIYEMIKGAKSENDLLFTVPRLAYIVGREERDRDAIGLVVTLLSDAILAMQTKQDFKGIQKCAEAMVAYQKYYSDK